MRVFHTLLLGASLSLAPAVSFASTANSSTPSAANPALHAPAAQRPGAAPQAAQKPTTDDRRYAARELASPDAADYRGGDTVVIGASAATAILAVLLLVILL
jgi:hypothetical protein